MGKYFSREEMIPMVEDWINAISRELDQDEFVSHRAIVETLLIIPHDEPEYKLIKRVSDSVGKAPRWVANNMVQWFSQWITVGNSDSGDRFERIEVGRVWAYRPRRRG